MSRRPTFQRNNLPANGRHVRHSPRHRRLAFEPLEVRRMLAVLAVGDIHFAPRDVVSSTAVHDVDEGSEVVATAVASGEGTLLYDWKLTQGATVVVQGNNPTFQFTPLDDANYSVTLTISDSTQSVATRTESLTVRNVRPVLVVAPNQIVGDGKLLDLTGIGAPPLALFIDDGILDTHAVTVDWGDGTALATPTMYSDGKGSVALGGSHTYANDGIYLVTVKVVDDDGGSDAQSFFVTMLTNDGPVDEGSSASVSFGGQFDPSLADKLAGFRYAYDFDNDGEFDVGNGTYAGSVANPIQVVAASYLKDGPGSRTVRARMIDEYGDFAEGMTVITIENVAPTAALANNGPVDEGGSASVSFSGQFDPSLADTAAGFRYAYDFDNDGTFDVGDGTYADSATNGSQTVPAALLADGPVTRTIRAWIIDKDGGHNEYTTDIDVNNVDPMIDMLAITSPINVDGTATLSGTYSDAGMFDSHMLDVDWDGDNLIDQTVAVAGGTFSVDHVFAGSGTFNVNVFVRDDDGGSDTETIPVTVRIVNPLILLDNSKFPGFGGGLLPQQLRTESRILPFLLPPPPLPSNQSNVGDEGSGGKYLDASSGGPDQPDTSNDAERTLQELLSKARGTRRGEVIDAVYSLGDVELVSLLGIDMGDEPVSQKRQVAKKPVLERDRHGPAPALPSDPVVAADEPGRRTLAFWSALAGSTLSIGGGLWWFGWKRRRNTHRQYASSIQ